MCCRLLSESVSNFTHDTITIIIIITCCVVSLPLVNLSKAVMLITKHYFQFYYNCLWIKLLFYYCIWSSLAHKTFLAYFITLLYWLFIYCFYILFYLCLITFLFSCSLYYYDYFFNTSTDMFNIVFSLVFPIPVVIVMKMMVLLEEKIRI